MGTVESFPLPADPGNRASAETVEATVAAGVLAGDDDSVSRVRAWIRGAASPYRRFLVNDLDDLEQEILISLHKTLGDGRFRGESRLHTYVARMTHYRCIDRMRSSSTREMVDIEDLDLREEGANAHRRVEQAQGIREALSLVARMPEECRKLWRMIHDGLSYREMAERTGARPGALRVRVLRCRRKATELREQIEAQRR